jgi:ribulose-phosphate 3-epimerase
VADTKKPGTTTLARLDRLRSELPAILPSLLLCDFANLGSELRKLEEAGARCLHLDVMDGHFVPNMTYGMTIVEACRKVSDLPLDVHLMIANPGKYLQQFRDAGADIMTIHAEAVDDPVPLLEEIRRLGAGAGLAINPPTSAESILRCLPHCDMVLAMSVMPGFGGQSFNPVALEKLRFLRDWSTKNQHPLLLEVDGGVNEATIAPCAQAGAELYVVGSGIFRHADYARPMKELRDLAQI